MLIFLLLSHFFSQTDIRMETQSKKIFSPKNGKKFMQKGKGKGKASFTTTLPSFITSNQFCDCGVSFCPDSTGTKFGGKPGSKKPFKQYNNAERKSRPGKGRDGDKRQTKFSFSKGGKRKLTDAKDEGGEGKEISALYRPNLTL